LTKINKVKKNIIKITRDEAFIKILSDISIKYNIIARINKNIILNQNGCLEWTKSPNIKYGMISYRGVGIFIHIFTWCIFNNRTKNKGEVIRHICDNKRCCNPYHLLIGSHSDNMKDRKILGEDVQGSKLTNKDVENIIKLFDIMSITDIAFKYNIGRSAIADIKYGRTWKHITNGKLKIYYDNKKFMSDEIEKLIIEGKTNNEIKEKFDRSTRRLNQIRVKLRNEPILNIIQPMQTILI
jgi:predicted DNA-binding protein YlxM (UPF0122 family)